MGELPGSYDRWRTTPPDEPEECPVCGEPVVEDARERSVDCENSECDWPGYGYDWDAAAEKQAEARDNYLRDPYA